MFSTTIRDVYSMITKEYILCEDTAVINVGFNRFYFRIMHAVNGIKVIHGIYCSQSRRHFHWKFSTLCKNISLKQLFMHLLGYTAISYTCIFNAFGQKCTGTSQNLRHRKGGIKGCF